jgi:hypothetical protein
MAPRTGLIRFVPVNQELNGFDFMFQIRQDEQDF